ncbi:MAG TPA: (Fe-S)-binding protein [Anaeromyxobacteraceae bacterium]|nr:(Fe-S)-binding protein [Anaeromyxobacteraceae bacterium]
MSGTGRHPALDCVHCGFCLPVCPTWIAWGREPDSPRGRIEIARAMLDGAAPTPEMVTHLDSCLGCMACLAACPSGVRYDAVIEEARARVEEAGVRTPADASRRSAIFALFPHPGRLRIAALFLWLWRASGARWFARASGLTRLFPFLARLDALAPDLTLSDATATLAATTAAVGETRGRVALVGGCVQRVFFPGVNESTLRVLSAEGYEVVVPLGQGCCGALSVHAGRGEEARALTRDLVERLEASGADVFLVNAAGCGSHLKDLSHLFAGDPAWRDRAASFSRKVKDVTEFLAAVPARAERKPIPGKVAYHSPCHLGHAQGIQDPPRALLRSIPGLELVEVPEGDQCCGSAGIYNLVQVEASDELGARKAANVLATGASFLASANPGCTLQVQRVLREKGASVQAAHPIEILDASIQGKPFPGRK